MWLVLLRVAAAEPLELAWADLDHAVERAWEGGPGAATRASVEGARAAARAEPITAGFASVTVAPDLREAAPSFDDNTLATLGGTVGGGRSARRAAWAAEAEALLAADDAARLAFAEEVRAAWLDAWVAVAFDEHLREYGEELDAWLARLEPSVARGLLPRARLDDLAVERSRVRAEAAGWAEAADLQAVRLAGLLGAQVTVDPAGLPSLEEDPGAAGNPWRAVAERLDRLPEVRGLEAEVARLRAEGRAARLHPVTVAGGALLRRDPDGGTSLGPTATVTVPLGNPGRPASLRLVAEAEAADARRAWALTRLAGLVAAEAVALDAAEDRYARVVATVEAPMAERLGRLEAALEVGSVSVEAVVLAGRDLHEAVHARARAAADVLRRRARGQALATALSESP